MPIPIQHSYSFKTFILTVAIPIVTFWTVLLLSGYPLPHIDDLFFIGTAINLAKGGEFTNPYIEAWNSILSSGKFYFQPPFHSFTLAGWLKLTGIKTTSFLLFQYLCYNTFSFSCALLLRAYGFPRVTALCTTILFAAWHCNPNLYFSTGLRQDALGMAYLALGLWLLTRDSWWRYFLGFSLAVSAVFTAPITAAYAIPFTIIIPIVNFIKSNKKNTSQYWLSKLLALLAAIGLIFTLFLFCINFELQSFISDFSVHASLRRNSTLEVIPIFLWLITRGYGAILILPSYILFIFLAVKVFINRNLISIEHKLLFMALTLGIILNIFLYVSAIGFNFFFCWVGIVSIISAIARNSKIRIYAAGLAGLIFVSSQTLSILSLVQREYVPEYHYRQIREYAIANPNRKYNIDEVAARFVFDYKLPKNSQSWTFNRPPGAGPISSKDKPTHVTWIVSTAWLGQHVPELLKEDYPKVEILGRKFNSLPKKPFEITVVP